MSVSEVFSMTMSRLRVGGRVCVCACGVGRVIRPVKYRIFLHLEIQFFAQYLHKCKSKTHVYHADINTKSNNIDQSKTQGILRSAKLP